MAERSYEKQLMERIKESLPGHRWLWKIHDKVTGGVPDFEVAWNGYTSKFEVKMLHGKSNLMDVFRPRQLDTCVFYERATSRCWIIVFHWVDFSRRWVTHIYRPSFLKQFGDRYVPMILEHYQSELSPAHLWENGVQSFDGHAYPQVVRLVTHTHRIYEVA